VSEEIRVYRVEPCPECWEGATVSHVCVHCNGSGEKLTPITEKESDEAIAEAWQSLIASVMGPGDHTVRQAIDAYFKALTNNARQ
jgi:hypothetical protein